MTKENFHIHKSPEDLANQFASQLIDWIINHSENEFHLAISGGKTPDLLFATLAEKNLSKNFWQKVHFWWVDERMVSPTDKESNFGVAYKLLFSKIPIPEENIHRIKGENAPEPEAQSYALQIARELPDKEGLPVFDLILLGMGDDGHTASIFPNQMDLLESTEICAVATHPVSRQKRVTLTGKVINTAERICFLVTGNAKAERLNEINNYPEKAKTLPAAYIRPIAGKLEWHVDTEAVSRLKL